MSLIARHFESEGVPTLILGSALDILEAGKPPRAAFLNYPLGFEAGRLFDPRNQYEVLESALSCFHSLTAPGISKLDFEWAEGWEMVEQRERVEANQDSRSTRDTAPRYQTEDDRILAESAASN